MSSQSEIGINAATRTSQMIFVTAQGAAAPGRGAGATCCATRHPHGATLSPASWGQATISTTVLSIAFVDAFVEPQRPPAGGRRLVSQRFGGPAVCAASHTEAAGGGSRSEASVRRPTFPLRPTSVSATASSAVARPEPQAEALPRSWASASVDTTRPRSRGRTRCS